MPVYETVVELLDPEQIAAVAGADFLTFTSASTVRNFLAAVGGATAWLARGQSRPRVVSIGPVTSDELRAHGMAPDDRGRAARHRRPDRCDHRRVSASSRRPVITLLTDYGTTDEFVGVLHGVIATICPDARVIDLSHGVGRHDIRGGATILAQSLPYMPVGVHVAVVDPTVGGDRRAVALRLADGRMLVGPDNGLLWPAAQAGGGVEQAVEISQSPVAARAGRRRPSTGATSSRRSPLISPPGSRSTRPATARPLAAGPRGEPRARTEGGALLATVTDSDRFGNVQLGAGTRRHLAGCGSSWATVCSCGSVGRVASGHIRAHVQRRGRGRVDCCSRTPTSGSRSASTTAAPWSAGTEAGRSVADQRRARGRMTALTPPGP